MSNAGSALMGVGEADGENRAQKAVEAAIDSPLVEATIEGARGVLINVTGGPDLTMAEIEDAAQNITQRAAPDANIIFGATIDNELKGKIKISVIATGFDNTKAHFYQTIKKPIIESVPINHPSDTNESTNEISNQDIKKYLGDKDIPAGIDIVDEFDIPAFLRKKN
jgi:cell division protein FtsZ